MTPHTGIPDHTRFVLPDYCCIIYDVMQWLLIFTTLYALYCLLTALQGEAIVKHVLLIDVWKIWSKIFYKCLWCVFLLRCKLSAIKAIALMCKMSGLLLCLETARWKEWKLIAWVSKVFQLIVEATTNTTKTDWELMLESWTKHGTATGSLYHVMKSTRTQQ